MTGGTYQMLWDCPYCGTAKLLGLTHRHCPACGSAQDEEKRYFPSDEDKVAVADHVFSGADKDCPACSSPMSAAAGHCGNCGAAMDGAAAVALKGDAPPSPPKPEPKSKRGPMMLGCAALIMLAVLLLLVSLLWKKDVSVEATSRTWERSVVVEVKKAVSESAWCDDVPRDALSVVRSRKQRDTKKVPDGETCTTKRRDNGDGTFSEYQDCKAKFREEPVYAEWCTYGVHRWKPARTLNSAGTAAEAPTWPDVTLARSGDCLGCEREGERDDAYRVRFLDGDGDTHECDLTEPAWASIEVGSRWTSTASVIGGSLNCKGLTRAN